MKYTALFILCIPTILHANSGAKLHSLNSTRKTSYDQAYAEVKDLNYLRMKILGIKNGTTRLVDAWEAAKPNCSSQLSSQSLESCHAKLMTLSLDAEMQLSQLQSLTRSENYERLLRTPSNGEIQVQRLVQSTTNVFIDYIRQAHILRRTVGERLAISSFKAALSGVEKAEEQARRNVQCRMMPTVLLQKLNASRLSLLQGKNAFDAYLVMRSRFMAQEVEEATEALANECGTGSFSAVKAEVQAFLKSHPTPDVVRSYAVKSCAKVQDSDVELKAVCLASDFNPAVYYSLHERLRKTAGGK